MDYAGLHQQLLEQEAVLRVNPDWKLVDKRDTT